MNTTVTTPAVRAGNISAAPFRLATSAGLAGLAIVLATASGCSDKSAMAVAAAPSGTRVIAAAPSKANGSGVQVGAAVAPADPAQSTTVTLQFEGVTAVDAAASLTAEPGLRITSGGESFKLPVGNSSHAVQATADQAGLFYIHVTTTQEGRGSITSIPVQVGSAAAGQKLQSQGELKTGAGDVGKVVVMPVP
ncbi:MAG: hypothetical protein EOO54_29140 [Haliea sp.]|nr:MAG: hypothetical protein EOO54_29140 [Haliea sp.]